MEELTPGPELNARVARALGWTCDLDDDEEGEPYPILWNCTTTRPDRPSHLGSPPFSESFGWAWPHVKAWAVANAFDVAVEVTGGVTWIALADWGDEDFPDNGEHEDDALALCEAVLTMKEWLDSRQSP